MKVTRKDNHDSLWLKLTIDKETYVKLTINRRGVNVKFKGAVPGLANEVVRRFKALDESLSYGEMLDQLEKSFK